MFEFVDIDFTENLCTLKNYSFWAFDESKKLKNDSLCAFWIRESWFHVKSDQPSTQ